jgi:hypothetical protein
MSGNTDVKFSIDKMKSEFLRGNDVIDAMVFAVLTALLAFGCIAVQDHHQGFMGLLLPWLAFIAVDGGLLVFFLWQWKRRHRRF